ncbi:UNVERIFIED_CONTAM: hypothetical protein RMT77_000196 [Armadillidium vulgare]
MPEELVRLRKVKPFEMFFEVAQKEFQFMIICYWLKLRSTEKLKPDHVKEAITILFKNTDNLNLCLKEIENELWFCRMSKESLDFQVIENLSPVDVLQKETCKSFNSENGPLWRVKFFPENSNIEMKEENEHMSDAIFSFHHIITDGFTSSQICNNFVEVLNDVICGLVKSEYKNFGKFSDSTETDELIKQRIQFFQDNPKEFQKITNEMIDFKNRTVVLNQLFPVPDDVSITTKHLMRDLEEGQTILLLSKFRKHGVTFHSGFTAVANWAYMEILTENGFKQDFLDMGAYHAVNVRRYWKPCSSIQLGCHIGPMRLVVKTHRNIGKQFWEHAHEIQNKLQTHLKERKTLDEIIAYPLTSKSGESYNFAELFSNPPPLNIYYSTSNMGDLSSILKNEGKHVNIDWLTRSTSCHSLNMSFIHLFHTLNGRFMYGMDYSTKYITDSLADLYVEKIFNKLELICNSDLL